MHKCIKCNNHSNEVKALVRIRDNEFICNQCIDSMKTKIDKSLNAHNNNTTTAITENNNNNSSIPSAKKIVEYLDQYIIGQNDAKQTIAVAVRNHFKRLSLSTEERNNLQKSNILIIGNSGTGKTAIIQRVAECIDSPLLIVDANRYTASGYTGDEVEQMIQNLYILSGKNKEKTEHGIIFIDEIDKKRKEIGQSSQKDLGGEEVQKSLLKIIEGTRVKVDINTFVDTSNILFIAGGAFVGLDKIIQQRISNKSIGFIKSTHEQDLIDSTSNEDLLKFGMIPEFIGRFSVFAHTLDLTEEELLIITKEPKNSVYKQFTKLFAIDGIELVVNDDVIKKIVSEVKRDKVGVRGLSQRFEKLLKEQQYELEDLATTLNINKIEYYLDTNNKISIKQHKKRGKKLEKQQ